MSFIINLKDVNLTNSDQVGGKNASTGEMLQHLTKIGINVPNGFATTADAYQAFLKDNKIDSKIASLIKKINPTDILALQKMSRQIKKWIIASPFSYDFEQAITKAYHAMGNNVAVAVRSSATTEDLVEASFAGAQETYLNIRGVTSLLHAIKLVYASLYTSRAIAYRLTHGFDNVSCAISVGIQPMIRSDKGASGVLFTIDTETGFDNAILITGAYGLGEAIVQGQITPDEFIVFKPSLISNKEAILQRTLGSKTIKMVYTHSKHPQKTIKTIKVPLSSQKKFCLSDNDIHLLAKQALQIEKHYGKPMDIEWAKDGINGKLYILQARPETVKSRRKNNHVIERYRMTASGNILTEGQSIGQGIGNGRARVILNAKSMHLIKPGDVLVTDMTDPDWEPIMKIASAIVTNRGGRTCHAAIIARELGIPAVVGCIDATKKIKNNEPVTVSCASGNTGYVYAGNVKYECTQIAVNNMPPLPIKLYMNMGNPEKAFAASFLPNDGVGLARLEFIISNSIGIHPNAALAYPKLPAKLKKAMQAKTAGYKHPTEFYIEKLREGIAMIAAAFYPKEVIFRFSDFKSNEYANLLGGTLYEPVEENPMIGFRGASRYNSALFRKSFELECKAFNRVRNNTGLSNAHVMIPFVRTVTELKTTVALMESYGLKRGDNGLKIYMMCEIPSNVILAQQFLHYVDGFSIGSNDLTQLTLGLDRDSNLVASLFDERNDAIKTLLTQVIADCQAAGKPIGICGQAPSDYPEFAQWLLQAGVSTMSLSPDTIVETWLMLGKQSPKRSRTNNITLKPKNS